MHSNAAVVSSCLKVDGAVQSDSNDWLAVLRNDNKDDVLVSVDDEVQIKGLVSAPQFNGMRG